MDNVRVDVLVLRIAVNCCGRSASKYRVCIAERLELIAIAGEVGSDTHGEM